MFLGVLVLGLWGFRLEGFVGTADIVHTVDTLDIVKSVNSVDNVSSANKPLNPKALKPKAMVHGF